MTEKSVAQALMVHETLTLAEVQRLDELEKVVDDGLTVFVKVGNALLEIRDSRLYRQAFPTFEAYCRERWGMVRRNADRLIQAAEVAENLRPTGLIPESERQARPLTRLEPEVQREVWTAVVDSTPAEQITAKVVEKQAKAAESLNEAVKEIKEALQPDPVQPSIIPEPPQPKDPLITEVTEKVKRGEMTVMAAAKQIEKMQQAVIIQDLQERLPKAAPKPPESPPKPDPVFETVLPNGKKIAEGDPKALWLWGWLLECEDRFLSSAPAPDVLASNFLDFMTQDSQRLIPKITHYLNQLLEIVHEPVA